MRVDFVTHCYAKQFPHFAAALYLQLSTICNQVSTKHQASITVFYCEEDRHTCNVLNLFSDSKRTKSATLACVPMRVENLGRRSIGRNFAAENTSADYVWFTDVDYWFDANVVDDLCTMQWPKDAVMVFPQNINISKTHELGDKLLKYYAGVYEGTTGSVPYTPNLQVRDYCDKTYYKAIGGVQIVKGSFATENGYVRGGKWQIPSTKPFGDFKDDIAYRNACRLLGKIVPVELKGVYRIRHTETSYQ